MSLEWFLQFTGPYHTYSVCLSQIHGVLERPPIPLRPLPDTSPKYRVSKEPYRHPACSYLVLGLECPIVWPDVAVRIRMYLRRSAGSGARRAKMTQKSEDSSFEVLGVSFEG